MSANMLRKKNWFELLAPLWAVIGMALHAGSIWFVYFHTEDYKTVDNYQSFIRYLIWAAVVLIALFSFAPDGPVSIVRHTVFYLVAAAAGVVFIYWYANNKFTSEDAELRSAWVLFASGLKESDYVKYYLRYTIFSSVGLCAAVGAFCAIKNHMSASGWIKKHIK
ncbi:MAG: hypothetical protein IKN17_13065 [Ruminococcus sp.]|nr:hypothetical protein [Ruminococcus sp.]